MAWIIGSVSKEELTKLQEMGWKDEDPPTEYKINENDGNICRAFYVDNDVFKIMTGPDWDTTKIIKKWFKCVDPFILKSANIRTLGIVFCYYNCQIQWFSPSGMNWLTNSDELKHWKKTYSECTEQEAIDFLKQNEKVV